MCLKNKCRIIQGSYIEIDWSWWSVVCSETECSVEASGPYAVGMTFTPMWFVAMTLALTGLHTYYRVLLDVFL